MSNLSKKIASWIMYVFVKMMYVYYGRMMLTYVCLSALRTWGCFEDFGHIPRNLKKLRGFFGLTMRFILEVISRPLNSVTEEVNL